MGLLMDLRSGKRDRFGLGAYPVIFWVSCRIDRGWCYWRI